jgi:hypothetical protein
MSGPLSGSSPASLVQERTIFAELFNAAIAMHWRRMATMSYPRIVGPEALSQFYAIFDEVWEQLVKDGVAASFDTGEIRTRLANKVLAFTLPSHWSDIQIRQLLVRAIRNETARKNLPTRPRPAAPRLAN